GGGGGAGGGRARPPAVRRGGAGGRPAGGGRAGAGACGGRPRAPAEAYGASAGCCAGVFRSKVSRSGGVDGGGAVGSPPGVEGDAMRILILDDDPSRSETLAASVARACPDAEVRRASGATVARAVAETAPALAVVGPGLVDGDGGGELVRALCADRPGLAVLG